MGGLTGVCTHWTGVVVCHAQPTRLYLTGWRCPAHTPAALAGRPEAAPDPARTLAGLRAAAGLRLDYLPPISTSSLVDERAVASGKRRASTSNYRAAQAAEHRRREQAPRRDWHTQAIDGVGRLAEESLRTGLPFTIFEISRFGVPDPPDYKTAWGGLARDAHHLGLIEHVGYTESKRPGTKGSAVKTWRAGPAIARRSSSGSRSA